jgi:hypothetical protein
MWTDQETWTQAVRELVCDRLVEFCPEGMDTRTPPLERTSHFNSFYSTILNKTAIGDRFITDWDVAGYKIDDSDGYPDKEEFLYAERARLLKDLAEAPSIVEFIVTKFRFKP